jgi:membrane-bound lytic murein transglycosylase D
MQQSRFKPLYAFALLTSLALPSAHAADLSIAAQVAGTTAAEGEALDAPHLGPAEFDAKFEQVEISQFDLWERIRQGFAIPDLNNPLVATHVTWYSSRPEYIQRTTQRASRYLFHVVQELEKRNMPMELALLPFIESAFNPQALSSAKAAGMWQFIPSTGRDYNLKQNVFRDERRDVVASTNAALNYLQKLYGMFGDWQLALAAYNWGEGSVSRAIAKAEAAGKPIEFNSLSAYMPAETRNYYPKLQAVKNLIAAPAQYGIKLPLVENQPYFVSIKKTRDIDVKLAAELAELPMEEFRALNPQFNRPVITGSSGASILLPQLNAEKFTENLSKWTRGLSSWTAHKVTAARERIEVIAARFKTTPQIIREANAIPPNMHPTVGSTVLVPKPANIDNDIARELADHGTLAVEADGPARRRVTIKVGRRDTMASITQRYKVSAAEVREWNDLKSDKLSPGQPLKLMVKAPKKGKTRLVAAAADHGDKPAQAGKRHAKAGKSEKPARERKAVKAERQVKKVEPRKKHGA